MSNRSAITIVLGWLGIGLVFAVFSYATGGMAINGKLVAGHFYLGADGHFVEVSRGIYVVSALLSTAFGLTIPAMSGVMIWSEWGQSRQSTYLRYGWPGFLVALAVGLGVCFVSIRCIVRAVTG